MALDAAGGIRLRGGHDGLVFGNVVQKAVAQFGVADGQGHHQ